MSGSLGMILVPAASGVGAVLVAVTHQDRPLLAAAGLLVLAASIAVGLAMVIGMRTGVRRRTREQRERYLDYLEQARDAACDGRDLQRRRAAMVHPAPQSAAGIAWQAQRRWERRPTDPDFLMLRVGLGVVPLNRPVTLQVDPNDPLVEYDPVCLAAAQDLAAQFVALAEQPVCVPLAQSPVACFIGSAERTQGVVRAMLAQLAWSHSPAEVAVLVCTPVGSGLWEWLKWLPHSLSGPEHDGPLPSRLITDNVAQALGMLTGELTDAPSDGLGVNRRMLVVIDQSTDMPLATGNTAAPTADLPALGVAAKAVGALQIHLLLDRRAEPDHVDIRVLVGQSAGADRVDFTASPGISCRLDQLTMTESLLLAKSFAPLRAGAILEQPAGTDARRTDPLGFGNVAALDLGVSWRPRTTSDLLRVPIGTAVDGSAVLLDLKESAQGGMGPHGLVVGATGSGKSELLRTLVTALAINHPPETLALLLADFKGGATFSGLATLPHVAGMITNLEADLSLVDRFRDALGGEVQRRQEVLASVGKLTSLGSYLELRRRRPDLAPMPHLLVIVDEFSELLGARPDLADLFVTIGRIGRSIGIHLLLATQRLDTGRIRGLESHLSYRICLRTFSESESREAIGSPDAYHLPGEPGWGYLRGDSPEHRLFRAVTVSRPYRPAQPRQTYAGAPILPFHALNGLAARVAELHDNRIAAANSVSMVGGNWPDASAQSGPWLAVGGRRDRPEIGSTPSRQSSSGMPGMTPSTAAPASLGGHSNSSALLPSTSRSPEGRTVLDVAADRLTALAPLHPNGHQARPVWLDPLPAQLTLDDLLSRHDSRGGSSSPGPEHIAAAIGLVDVPQRQRQELLTWDFTDGNGNLLIVGAGRSGKSTALRTLLVSLALHHPPGEIEVICVDFGGETLVPLGELPQVAVVTTRSDPELTRRVFDRIRGLLAEREALFRRHRFESTAALRRARKTGAVGPGIAGDIVLMIDGWAGVGESDGVPDGALDEILGRGTGVGIHTVLTVVSPGQLRARLVGGFGGRIELRLSDSFDSVIDRQLAKALPVDLPGRALVAGRHYAQIAMPVLRARIAEPDQERLTSTSAPDDPKPLAGGAGDLVQHDPARVTGLAVVQHSADHVVASVRARWPGQSVARIRKLPERVSLADLLTLATNSDVGHERRGRAGLLLGLAEGDAGAVHHDLLGEDPHLMVLGDAKSGKTAVLRNVLTQLMAPPDELDVRNVNELAVVDYRRSLSLHGQPHRSYTRTGSAEVVVANNSARAGALCAAVATELARRLNDPAGQVPIGDPSRDRPPDSDREPDSDRPPGSDREPGGDDRVRAEIYLLVDDYNLVANAAGNPLHQLLPYLSHARDLGFHLILARHSGGAARAQYEPLLQALGDLGTPMLLLSGSPAEGRLAHGLVPQVLPPGRARLATRGSAPQFIQTPWSP